MDGHAVKYSCHLVDKVDMSMILNRDFFLSLMSSFDKKKVLLDVGAGKGVLALLSVETGGFSFTLLEKANPVTRKVSVLDCDKGRELFSFEMNPGFANSQLYDGDMIHYQL